MFSLKTNSKLSPIFSIKYIWLFLQKRKILRYTGWVVIFLHLISVSFYIGRYILFQLNGQWALIIWKSSQFSLMGLCRQHLLCYADPYTPWRCLLKCALQLCDWKHYFGLSLILKPKPTLADTFGRHPNWYQNHISKRLSDGVFFPL